MTFIQNLQNKPDSQKKTILFASVVILMLFVVGVWFLQMKNNSARRLQIQIESESQFSPISDLKDNIVNLYNESAEKIGDIKKGFESISQ